MKGMGLKFTPVVGRHLLRHSSMFGPIWLALLGPIGSPNSPKLIVAPHVDELYDISCTRTA